MQKFCEILQIYITDLFVMYNFPVTGLSCSYHGELDYMDREDRVARRANPGIILPGVQSVIMVGMVYWPGTRGFPSAHHYSVTRPNTPRKWSGLPDSRARGIVSSYAWGEDYHKQLGRRLRALGRHLNAVAGGVGRFYVDTGAILERDFAERARLGFVGKNSLLIHPRVGSGFFIGELFSTVPLPLDGDEDVHIRGQKRGQPGCGRCTRCIDACPTRAIVDNHVVDARRCISYLTIELKGSIPVELRRPMGSRIYGCDICQIVCPWNRFSWDPPTSSDAANNQQSPCESSTLTASSPLFGKVGAHISTPVLVDLLTASVAEFDRRFARSAIKRIGRDRMARNAAVALGNVGSETELQILQHVAQSDRSKLVREHASWAVSEVQHRLGYEQRLQKRTSPSHHET